MNIRRVAFGLVFAVALAGCGSSGGSSDPTAKFVGSWTFTSGTIGGNCALGSLSYNLAGGMLAIVKGAASSQIVAMFGGCNITFKVNGSLASADPGQSCNFNVPSVGNVPVAISSWTLDASDGVTLASSTMGSAAGICPVSGTGSASRSMDASAGGG